MQETQVVADAAVQWSALGIRLEGWLTLAAVLLGPILAVQAQAWIERHRAEHQRRMWIYRELMATRASRLSMRHVEALNLVDLEFRAASKREKPVHDAWRQYFDALNSQPPTDPALQAAAFQRRDDLFVDFLFEMGRYLKMSMDKVAVRRNSYSPNFHGTLERDYNRIREALVEILEGRRAVPITPIMAPPHPAPGAPGSVDAV